MSIDLTEKEQAVLDAACVRIEKATQEAQTLRQAAEQAARKAKDLAHSARGTFRTIMELRGSNPDAHQVNWDGTKATIEEKEPSNIVELPTPKDEAAQGGNA